METHYLDRQSVYDRIWSYYIDQNGLPGPVDSTCLQKVMPNGSVLRSPLAVLDQSGSFVQTAVVLATGEDLWTARDRYEYEFRSALGPHIVGMSDAEPSMDLLTNEEIDFLWDIQLAHESALDYVRCGLNPVIAGRVRPISDDKFDKTTGEPDTTLLRQAIITRLSEELFNIADASKLRLR